MANPWIGLDNYGFAGQLVDWPAIYYGSEVGSKNKANPLIGWPIQMLGQSTFSGCNNIGWPIHGLALKIMDWQANWRIGLQFSGLAGQSTDWPSPILWFRGRKQK